MTNSSRYTIKQPNIVSDVIEEEALIVDLKSGNYYSLQGSASQIWQQIQQGCSLDQIVAEMLKRYTGDQSQVEASVSKFLGELEAHSLVTRSDSSDGETASPDSNQPVAVEITGREAFIAPELQIFDDMQDLLLVDPIHDVDDQGWPHVKPKES